MNQIMSLHYEPTEQDIDAALRWLKINDPSNATPERAIEKVKEAIASAQMLGEKNPQALEKLFKDVKKKPPKKSA